VCLAVPSHSKLPEGFLESTVYLGRNLILLPGVFPERPMVTVSWTLVRIFSFCLALPLVLRAARWERRSRRWRSVFLCMAVASWLSMAEAGWVDRRSVFLLTGICVAEWGIRGRCGASQRKVAAAMAATGVLGFTLIGGVAGLLLRSAFLGAFLLAAEGQPILGNSGFHEILLLLGRTGYPFYLIHGFSLHLASNVLFPLFSGEGLLTFALGLLLPLGLALTLAELLHRFVELPMKRGNEGALQLLENGEVAGVPGLGDEIEFTVDLAHDGVVNVLEVGKAEVLLDHDRGDQLVVFEDIDGRAFAAVGAVQRSDDGVAAVIVDVTGK
jgi:peptidoglycan/LPS O-acetylase OafA/YrhL